MPGSGARLSRPGPAPAKATEMDRSASPDAPRAVSLTVRCRGQTGLLYSSNDELVYEGANADTAQSAACCLEKNLPVTVMPFKHVLGARQDDAHRNRVRVWYVQPSASGSGATAKLQYKLHQSDWFECSNEQEAQQLVVTIRRAASWGGRDFPPRVVVVVNPASGRGKAASVFNDTVMPLLADIAGLRVEVHTTSAPLHATRIVQALDLERVDLLLFVGGDGTTFEGMQGLIGRPDWKTAVRVPFGPIPTGSGNGLAASVGIWDPITAAYSACKRQTHPLDVASVLQPPNKRYYLQLSLTYGFMANIDIGTEHLRWMGEPRFTVGAAKLLMSGARWPLRAALWPAHVPPPGADLNVHVAPSELHAAPKAVASKPHAKPALSDTVQPLLATDSNNIKEALLGLDSVCSHDQSCAPVHFNARTSSSNGRSSKPLDTTADAPQHPPNSNLSSDADADAGRISGCGSQGVAGYPAGPPLPILSQFGGTLPNHLPQYEDQMPAGWQMLPDKVTSNAQYFHLHNTTHVALNAPLNPKGRLSDGVWELVHASNISKLQGAQMLINSDSGTAVDLPWVKTEQLRALVLEPQAGDTTWMVADGEQIARDQPVYMEVHPQLCNVLVAPGWTDGLQL